MYHWGVAAIWETASWGVGAARAEADKAAAAKMVANFMLMVGKVSLALVLIATVWIARSFAEEMEKLMNCWVRW